MSAGPIASLLVLFVVLLERSISSVTVYDQTFQKFQLADVARYQSKCPPEMIHMSHLPQIAAKIQCHVQCIIKGDCTFFSVNGAYCWLWTFGLDPSYSTADLGSQTTTAYKPMVSSGPQDIALGKPVSATSTFPGYNITMLTRGSLCFPVMEDCFCTDTGESKIIQVDLEAEYLVSKIAVMASIGEDCQYFTDMTIWAGVTGNTTTDTNVGTTSSQIPPDYETVEFSVNSIVRYITLERQLTLNAMCLCKIQAFL
ncbi:Galactose-binding domain-like [Trinorchestia longiramus]|nr:Galactose-binding domain-like [Trinorchestia longiramus]